MCNASPHLTPTILDQAERTTLDGDAATDVATWQAANRRFHQLIIAPCRMPRLLAVIDDLLAASARFLFTSWSSGWVTPKDEDHRAILTHLRAQKTEQAATVLDRHVQRIGHRPKEGAAAPERFAIVG